MSASLSYDKVYSDGAEMAQGLGNSLGSLARSLYAVQERGLSSSNMDVQRSSAVEQLLGFVSGDLNVDSRAGVRKSEFGASEVGLRSTLSRYGLCKWELVDVTSGESFRLPQDYWGTVESLAAKVALTDQNEKAGLDQWSGPSRGVVRVVVNHLSGVRVEAVLSQADFLRFQQLLNDRLN